MKLSSYRPHHDKNVSVFTMDLGLWCCLLGREEVAALVAAGTRCLLGRELVAALVAAGTRCLFGREQVAAASAAGTRC